MDGSIDLGADVDSTDFKSPRRPKILNALIARPRSIQACIGISDSCKLLMPSLEVIQKQLAYFWMTSKLEERIVSSIQ